MSKRKTNQNVTKDKMMENKETKKKINSRGNANEEKRYCKKCYCENEFQGLLRWARNDGRNFICVENSLEFLRFIRNVKCAMCIIKRLRNKGVNIHFIDEQLQTIDIDNDMEIGANLELAGQIMIEPIDFTNM